MQRRRYRSRPALVCSVRGCGRAKAAVHAVCTSCFAKLPRAQRDALVSARAGNRVTEWLGLKSAALTWLDARAPDVMIARVIGETVEGLHPPP